MTHYSEEINAYDNNEITSYYEESSSNLFEGEPFDSGAFEHINEMMTEMNEEILEAAEIDQ